MFNRILIANRGEIACRIARTCRQLGVEYVAVYSEVDGAAAHLEGAVETVCLGAGAASESYLNAEKLLAAARQTSCEAVHPGYGFLSENAAFAAVVEAAGLVFIGPTATTIAALGDKARAKALMRDAGVPVVPGTDEASDDPLFIEQQVRSITLPVLLKPSAGGGGKGMQIIDRLDGLSLVIESAIRVARNSFGDGRMIVERYIEQPRHIEVQVFGDGQGDVVHLFERECSLQRRHQKVLEEAPAPHLPAEARERLLQAAVQGAQSLQYRNAGTFEFIVDRECQCYFLEVNTRLQVEHPVTEQITGQDLVEWQLRVASGESLPLKQHEITCRGHAIEARIYAEDPAHDFRPAPGQVQSVCWPDRVRVDAGLLCAGDVPAFYDPMIAKIIATAQDRMAAIAALKTGLQETKLLGVASNVGYLLRVLDDPNVRKGVVHTRYLDERKALQTPHSRAAATAVAATLGLPPPQACASASPWAFGSSCSPSDRSALDPAAPLGRLYVTMDQTQDSVEMQWIKQDVVCVSHEGKHWQVRRDLARFGGQVEGLQWNACRSSTGWLLQVSGDHFAVLSEEQYGPSDAAAAENTAAPMAGVITSLKVRTGDRVQAGDVLAIIEAMKMEHPIISGRDGVVQGLRYKQGDSVREGDVIVDIDYEDKAGNGSAASDSSPSLTIDSDG